MSLLKATLMSATLIFGGASLAIAQDSVSDQAKDMAIDKGTDMAKDKMKDSMGEDKAKYVDPAAKAGKNMLKGDSAKDAVVKAGTSEMKSMGKNAAKGAVMGDSSMTDTSLSGEEAMTAGKVMMKGGSTEDAAMAVAKKRAKTKMMDKVDGMMAKEVGSSTVVTDKAVIESSTVVSTDPTGVVPPVKATVTTTTTPATAVITTPAATTVNCPSGTTAQPNGTCMITGDYKG